LIVRRTRLIGPQAELWPDWRHFAFLTNRTQDITIVEAEHRDHAVVEQVIADLKDQALAHFPSGDYDANSAWTVLAAIAHNDFAEAADRQVVLDSQELQFDEGNPSGPPRLSTRSSTCASPRRA
jgi:hypothetical protein